jgi:hypothetical protein
MRVFPKGSVIYWTDPDDGDCSQYAVVEYHEGDGVHRCTTVKGGELVCPNNEMRLCHKEEAELVTACMNVCDTLWRVASRESVSPSLLMELHQKLSAVV